MGSVWNNVVFYELDENSNQSSIADASPMKQENSSNPSPAPEQNLVTQAEGSDTRIEEIHPPVKEQPSSDGKLSNNLLMRKLRILKHPKAPIPIIVIFAFELQRNKWLKLAY